MSDVITFNTEKQIEERLLPAAPTAQPIKTFNLVPETWPVLRTATPTFDFVNPPVIPLEFASSLVETCKKNRGFGLAAPQCGYSHRVFVIGADDNYVAFFNPKVVEYSKEEVHMIEGCLSFPMLGLRITRPRMVTVEYQDFTGKSHNTTLDGISARCFLHELDHLNGIVYTVMAKPLALKSGMDKRMKSLKKITKMVAGKKVADQQMKIKTT